MPFCKRYRDIFALYDIPVHYPVFLFKSRFCPRQHIFWFGVLDLIKPVDDFGAADCTSCGRKSSQRSEDLRNVLDRNCVRCGKGGMVWSVQRGMRQPVTRLTGLSIKLLWL